MDKVIDLKKKKQEEKGEPEEKYELFESPVSKASAKTGSGGVSHETNSRREDSSSEGLSQPVQVSWSGLLHQHSTNMKALAIFSTILFAVGVFFIFFQKNIFAAAFFIASAAFLLVSSKKQAPEADFVVGPLSVRAGSSEYNFKEIKSFWVEYNPGGFKELSLQLKKWYQPYIKIPLYHQNPVQIRTILLKFIPEVEHEDTVFNVIEKVLGY